MSVVAVIGDVGGYVGHLRHALRRLGVAADGWPGGLHVVQVGDLFGGRADVEVARLVKPHIEAGRWTQLVGNWELGAVGGSTIGRAGRSAHPDALAEFAHWYDAGLVRFATTVRGASGVDAVVTHAGITGGFWARDLGSERDAAVVVERVNEMALDQVARPGSMYGSPGEPAVGPIWASTDELWPSWTECPWPQVHGHVTAHSPSRGWAPWTPESLRRHAQVRGTHVVYQPPNSAPIIGIDPALWDRSPAGALQPLVLRPSD